MKIIKFCLLFIGAFFVNGQMPYTGPCPSRSPLNSIDARKLLGVWYENQRSPDFSEWPYKCISFKIQPFYEHKSTLEVTALQRMNGQLEKQSIPLKSKDPEGRNGKISASISDIHSNGIYSGLDLPLQLLAMDQEHGKWVVIWSCRSFTKAMIHAENAWVITREREINETTSSKIRDAIVALNLEHLIMRDTIQTHCDKIKM